MEFREVSMIYDSNDSCFVPDIPHSRRNFLLFEEPYKWLPAGSRLDAAHKWRPDFFVGFQSHRITGPWPVPDLPLLAVEAGVPPLDARVPPWLTRLGMSSAMIAENRRKR